MAVHCRHSLRKAVSGTPSLLRAPVDQRLMCPARAPLGPRAMMRTFVGKWWCREGESNPHDVTIGGF